MAVPLTFASNSSGQDESVAMRSNFVAVHCAENIFGTETPHRPRKAVRENARPSTCALSEMQNNASISVDAFLRNLERSIPASDIFRRASAATVLASEGLARITFMCEGDGSMCSLLKRQD